MRDDLRAGNKTAVATDNTNFKSDENNLAYQIANNGVVQSRLQTAEAYLSDHSAAIDKAVNTKSGADLADTIVALSEAQNG